MANRVYNFGAGPATLPLPVLEQAQQEFMDFAGTGMSIVEVSHRTKEYEALNSGAEALAKELLGIPEGYRVLFLQGGASLQFAMVPMAFLKEGSVADYIVTGTWSEKAQEEAAKLKKGEARVAFTSKDTNHNRIPKAEEISLSDNPSYIHITSNNTIFGTQWQSLPDYGPGKLVADMSSDIMSRPFDVSRYGIVYAGAQKNLGPSGVTMVIISPEMLEKADKAVPTMLRYDIHAKNDSLYNTPSTFSVYCMGLVLEWLKGLGGLDAVAGMNARKAKLIYDAIDNSGGFYKGHAQVDSRSLMNITFTLPDADLEKEFASLATKAGMVGLKGHRSVGGMRASVYNAMPEEGCKALADFMAEFMRTRG